MNTLLAQIFENHPQLFVQQRKEWAEIIIDFETANQYAILDSNKRELGVIAEHGGGFMFVLKRWLLRSHRPFDIEVLATTGEKLLHLKRDFFFFFSDLEVATENGERLGSIHRRFGILYKKYDLYDSENQLFARIQSPLWRLWTFPVVDALGNAIASVNKHWGGVLREVFTDADTYMIDFAQEQTRGGLLTHGQRAVVLAAAISIDFDFFENNQGRSGGIFDLVD